MVVQEPCDVSEDPLGSAVSDHYRCPHGFLDFAVASASPDKKRSFKFGAAACYGQVCVDKLKRQVDFSVEDLRRFVSVKDGTVVLPFRPTEVIENLRLERYPIPNAFGQYFRRLYYRLRPLTTRSVRKRIQQFHARKWRELTFPNWPVDTTVENLCEELLLLSMNARGIERLPFVWFWPQGARGCVMMTHDVETAAGRDFCDKLMDVDQEFGVKASFQIIPEGRYSVTETFLQRIRDRGFEIGIQDLNHDGRLFDNKKEFLRRLDVINQYAAKYCAKGFRAAVLYRKHDWLETLNCSFDMSVPNVAHLDPQRGGCCTVFPYFIGKVLELPLTTTQDYMLFHVLNERSVALWKDQTDLILAKNGLASFIIHPDYINEPSTMSVYRDLLGYLSDLRERTPIWFALPSDVDSWWRARRKMSVVEERDSWRIRGEGADRAVLAYAKIVDGRLVYELPEGTSSA